MARPHEGRPAVAGRVRAWDALLDGARARPTEALLWLLALGLAVRLIVALVIFPASGFPADLNLLSEWADRAYAGGGFYRQDEAEAVVTYPPAYLLVLWAIGALNDLLGSGGPVPWLAIKLPPMLADIALGWLLFRLGLLFGSSLTGLAAAGLWVLNPASIFDSAIWGQNEAPGVLAAVAALYLLVLGRAELAAAAGVVASLVKFQFGFVVPIIGVVIIKRYLFGRSTDAGRTGPPLRAVTALATAALTATVLMFPWGLSLFDPGDPDVSLVHRFRAAEGAFPWLTLDAFNLWTNPLVGNMRTDSSGLTYGHLVFDPLQLGTFGGLTLTSQGVGFWLFLGTAALALLVVARRDDRVGVLVAAAILVVAFFVLPTRVHERYLVPILAIAAPMAVACGGGWRWAYGLATLSCFLNMYFVYTLPGAQTDLARDPLLNATILSPVGIYLLSAGSVALLGWLIWRGAATAGLVPARISVPWLSHLSRELRMATRSWPMPRPRPDATSVVATRLVVLGIGIAVASAVFLANIAANPPGFFWDESGIAYNAWRIASTGADMNGERWPVYTTFIGGAMNMPFVYVLSLVFAATGPSIMAARLVAGILGLGGGLVIGVVAARMSRRWWIGALGAAAALSSPWLFENSRLVFEVAIYPLAIGLLLLTTQRAARHAVWSAGDIVAIAAALALVTYGYSVGRLLGPLLAAALVVFVTRVRWQSVVGAWVLYGLLMLPAAVFAVERPGWLTGRFEELGYLGRAETFGHAVAAFADHYLRILNPVQMLLTGDPNQRHHVAGVTGSVPIIVALLALAGVVWITQRRLAQPWWRYLLIGLVVSPVPAALTDDSFHSLRLVPFFTSLTIVACYGMTVVVSRASRSAAWRMGAVALLLVAVVQATYFVVRFHQEGPGRGGWLDAGFGALFANAAGRGETIHVVDGRVPTHLHALWYATLTGLPEGRLELVDDVGAVEAGALVLSGEEACQRCEVLAQDGFYTVYRRTE